MWRIEARSSAGGGGGGGELEASGRGRRLRPGEVSVAAGRESSGGESRRRRFARAGGFGRSLGWLNGGGD